MGGAVPPLSLYTFIEFWDIFTFKKITFMVATEWEYVSDISKM
jgi:hypothetical protein